MYPLNAHSATDVVVKIRTLAGQTGGVDPKWRLMTARSRGARILSFARRYGQGANPGAGNQFGS